MDVFGALADPVRRALLARLAAGPRRVVDLAAEHAVSRPAVSKHLRRLSDAGLVTSADSGRERHYALRREGLAPVGALLRELAGDGAAIGPSVGPSVAPSISTALDALDTEVRRTVRDRRATTARREPEEETA